MINEASIIVRDKDGKVVTSCYEEKFVADRDATFIATFDPEHVALMEAVLREIERDGCLSMDGYHEHLVNLTKYRKEHDLL